MTPDAGRLPQIYRDGENEAADPARLAVTRAQYEHLGSWASGNFTDDWSGPTTPSLENRTQQGKTLPVRKP